MTRTAAFVIAVLLPYGAQGQASKAFSAPVVMLTEVQKQDGAAVAAMVKGQRECQLLGKVVFAPPSQSGAVSSPGGWFIHFNQHACADKNGGIAKAPVFGVVELTQALPRGSEITVNGVR